MTLRSELVNELEKAFTDEAYDGGMGALSEDEFAHLVRTLAATAHSVFEKVHTPIDDEREALEVWSFQHRPILSMRDGSIASCKCMDRVFINGREDWDQHIADSLIAARFRSSEVPDPQGKPEACLERGHANCERRVIDGEWWTIHHPEPQGEPYDGLTIPRPHVPYGPHGVPEREADADYLDSAARNLSGGYAIGGYNVTSTVIKLLHDTATALRAAGGVR